MNGKKILEAIQNLKLQDDINYFTRQSYDLYMKDPLGKTFKQQMVRKNPEVI